MFATTTIIADTIETEVTMESATTATPGNKRTFTFYTNST